MRKIAGLLVLVLLTGSLAVGSDARPKTPEGKIAWQSVWERFGPAKLTGEGVLDANFSDVDERFYGQLRQSGALDNLLPYFGVRWKAVHLSYEVKGRQRAEVFFFDGRNVVGRLDAVTFKRECERYRAF